MGINSISILKANKLKVTPQRIVLLDILNSGGHYTGEQIHTVIRRKEPNISLSTVYNTLDTFEREGILASFEVDGMKWYESKTESHVNIYCTDSKKIIDLDMDVSQIAGELKKRGISVTKINIVAFSECGIGRKHK